jgi:hypothetical protein
MELAVHGSGLTMRQRGSGNGDAHRLDIRRPLHITLCDGFRGHAVVILVDGKAVYHRAAVTTDASTSRADAVDLVVASRQIEVAVSVTTPGEYSGSVSLDVGMHPHLAVSLIGEGTIGFEISTHRVP